MTTSTNLLDRNSIINDARYFCKHLIEIEDRDRNVIQFEFNPAQELLHNNLLRRDLIVKAGQLGISTFVLALNFKETLTVPGTTSVIVAHEEFLTTRLLQRVNTWCESKFAPTTG